MAAAGLLGPDLVISSMSKQVWLLFGYLIDRVGTYEKTNQTMFVNGLANSLEDCWTKFGASMDFMSKISAYSHYKRAYRFVL